MSSKFEDSIYKELRQQALRLVDKHDGHTHNRGEELKAQSDYAKALVYALINLSDVIERK